MKRFITYLLLLTLNVFSLFAQTGEVHILSVNDMHAAIERFPQLAYIVDSLRNVYPDLLVLSAGDNRTGNPINDIHPVSSKPVVDLMNKVGFNYSAIGNHEFDAGTDGLRTVINNAYFTFLCANMYALDSLRLLLQPFTFVERNGIRIGILGLVQTSEATGVPDAHPKYFTNLKYRPLNEVAKEYKWMRRECDVFVLLTHNGFEGDIELASIMPEADIIIGGHSHTKVDPCKIENGVMITQAERFLKYATLATFVVKDGKVVDKRAQLFDVRNYPNKDIEVQTIVDNYSDNPVLLRVLTKAASDFSNKEELGCLMADALRAELHADIAVQNSGGVRYDYKEKGNITVNDIYRLDPFGNELVEYKLTGEEVERMLAAVSCADDYGPAYVSGIKYKIHLGKDNKDVKKVTVMNSDGSKFDKKRTYSVVMSSYMASVSDYEKQDEGRNLFVVTSDVIMDYLSKQPYVDYFGVSRVEVKQDVKYGR
ncbi:MAG: bifunctional UDP-sugar hydrolase/5'-nucleotidase [Bacteroidales bacterium]|nr:bifunctional UDP-sugar hydrolase/5'-nucleotidase [Bacteroidales bacterium]